MTTTPTIIYTHTDEAPALATYSLLPIIRAFVHGCGIEIETRDISLSGRILAAFSDVLPEDQRTSDALAELGAMALTPDVNIIKLPNISASIPQLKAAIKELQSQGFNLPDYPDEPANDEERDAKARYDSVKGSAVNPVLRQGNSDRRAPKAVKEFAKANPPRMGQWPDDSASHVASMPGNDFRANEQSVTIDAATTARIEHVDADGNVQVLKDGIALEAGEVLDGTFMSVQALTAFLKDCVDDARAKNVLFSLHMKATMMKVSDPIIFGYAVQAYFADLFEAHGETFEKLGVDVRNGFGDVISRITELPDTERAAIEADIDAAYANGPALAMVDSDRGITNLHVPSDVIIDASMPVVVRDSGRMWNPQGELQDCKAIIPDRSYSGVYQTVIEWCQEHGAFDPTTMGSVSNVGLMAMKAEEYGSHDKTFEAPADGTMRIVDANGTVFIEHTVQKNDIWRACQVKDAAVRDWVGLAVRRARATGVPAVFWLDESRAHDAQLIAKVRPYLEEHETEGLEIHILAPADATRFSLERLVRGEDTISVTGNVLRDYLTDLFPILEVGTSARMLSIVPLLAGGGLFETGAGGSAPKHVQQFAKENHLRWDSLGEFMALAASFDHVADRFDHATARVLGKSLDDATAQYLLTSKTPSRRCGELDNRGSHFYLALYWARALASQTDDAELAARFKSVAASLEEQESTIIDELNGAQGPSVDLNGYYRPDASLAASAMRPSTTFNEILDSAMAAAV